MRTIVITGSSSGIGKATAKLFAQKGWTVIATMRTPEKETELTQYENIVIYPMDVTNAVQVKDISSKILEKYDVDVLFNNVGYGMKIPFEEMKEEEILKSLDTNVLGMIRVTQQFIPYFKKKRCGTILTTTSLAGKMGLILNGIYVADKWALSGICEMLYYELAPFNIQVKTLVPGVVKTNFKVFGGQVPKEYENLMRNQLSYLIPDKDNVENADQAATDVWNAVNDPDVDRMEYVTGTVAQNAVNKINELGSDGFRRYYKAFLLRENNED